MKAVKHNKQRQLNLKQRSLMAASPYALCLKELGVTGKRLKVLLRAAEQYLLSSNTGSLYLGNLDSFNPWSISVFKGVSGIARTDPFGQEIRKLRTEMLYGDKRDLFDKLCSHVTHVPAPKL